MYEHQSQADKLADSIKQLVRFMPADKKNDKQTERQEVMNQLNTINTEAIVQVETTTSVVKKQIEDLAEFLSLKSKQNLFAGVASFTFSEQHKHTNITLVSPICAKVTGGQSGYKFAVMTPSLQLTNKPVKFGFKMKVSTHLYCRN